MTFHDTHLPHYQFREYHTITVRAKPERIYPMIRSFDFSGSKLIKILFMLRGLPAVMVRMEGVQKEKFVLLQEQMNTEIIIGLIGQFWKPDGNLKVFSPAEFATIDEPGHAKATWNFRLVPQADTTVVETETRIHCTDSEALRKFSRYWFLIRPFSGLIRREMLKAIKKSAER
ncbi:MAG TPA: hypothetical protein VD816_17465 [Ohtaekwangia sp.]|nr:hypothetical protein [Ohtaekwangia sp.]